MKSFFNLLTVLALSISSISAQDMPNQGAKSLALGNAVAGVPDEWALFNSIGGIASAKSTSLLAGFDQMYGIEGMNQFYFGYLQKLGHWSVGTSVSRTGDPYFSQSKLSAGLGSRLGIASLGLRVSYHQVMAEGYETQSALSIDFGGIAELSPHMLVGAEIRNLSQSRYSNSENAHVPVSFKCGINIIPYQDIQLLAEIERELSYETYLKFGVQYSPVENLHLRAGINSEPARMFFGVGFEHRTLAFDYGFGHQNQLGFIHSLGLGYRFISDEE